MSNYYAPVETERDGTVVVYTDGACLRNGRFGATAGIGVFWDYGHPDNVSWPLDGEPTNNRAEIQAAVTAMDIASDQGYNSLKIVTDSDYLINGATDYIYKWLENGWRNARRRPVRNRDDWEMLYEEMQNFDYLEWQHVYSHGNSGNRNPYEEGNHNADKLAREGAIMARNDYWS